MIHVMFIRIVFPRSGLNGMETNYTLDTVGRKIVEFMVVNTVHLTCGIPSYPKNLCSLL